MAELRTAPGQTRRTGKLTPIEGEKGAPRKIFTKKDLVESVRRMALARYGNNAVPKGSSVKLGRAGDAPENSQLNVMSNGVNMNAKKFNELKLLGDRKAKELKTRLDVLTSLKVENDALVEMKKKETPESIRIEELLVKIEKVRKHTEDKLHYRRQLQHMKRRLAANQITFDAHINAMEDALRQAIREHDDVKALMRQLEAGKTKAVLDLHEIQRQVSVERRDRTKVLTLRKMEASNAEKMETWRQEREVMRKEFASELKGDMSEEEERALQGRLKEREDALQLFSNLIQLPEIDRYQAIHTLLKAHRVRDPDKMFKDSMDADATKAAQLENVAYLQTGGDPGVIEGEGIATYTADWDALCTPAHAQHEHAPRRA